MCFLLPEAVKASFPTATCQRTGHLQDFLQLELLGPRLNWVLGSASWRFCWSRLTIPPLTETEAPAPGDEAISETRRPLSFARVMAFPR